MSTTTQTFRCETCPIRRMAEANPQSLMARLWRWHTTWCPGWKAYQKYLAEQNAGDRRAAPNEGQDLGAERSGPQAMMR